MLFQPSGGGISSFKVHLHVHILNCTSTIPPSLFLVTSVYVGMCVLMNWVCHSFRTLQCLYTSRDHCAVYRCSETKAHWPVYMGMLRYVRVYSFHMITTFGFSGCKLIYIYTYIYDCICASRHIYICTHIYICIHMNILIWGHMFVCMHAAHLCLLQVVYTCSYDEKATSMITC